MRRQVVLESCLVIGVVLAALGVSPAVSAERGTPRPASTPRRTAEVTPPASTAPTSRPAQTEEERNAVIVFYVGEGLLCVPVLLLLVGGIIIAHKIGGRAGRVQMLGIVLAASFIAMDWVLKDPHLKLLKSAPEEWSQHWQKALPVALLIAAYVFAAGFLAVAYRVKPSPPKPSGPSSAG